MNVNEMIVLEDGCNYGLILKSVLNNDNYFLAVKLNDNEEPTDEYKVLKEVISNGELFVTMENDPFILEILLKDYRFQNVEE